MGSDGLERFGEVLWGYIEDRGWGERLEQSQVIVNYNGLRDEVIRKNSVGYKVEREYLYIYVRSSVFASEIHLRSLEILEEVNRGVEKEENRVKGLRTRVVEMF